MNQRIKPQCFQGIQIQFLNIVRRGLQDDLKLIIVLQSVGVFTVAAIGWATAGLNVSGIPGFRADGTKEGRWVKGTGADFHIQRLKHHATVPGPELLQGQDQALKSLDVWIGIKRCLVCHDDCLLSCLYVAWQETRGHASKGQHYTLLKGLILRNR